MEGSGLPDGRETEWGWHPSGMGRLRAREPSNKTSGFTNLLIVLAVLGGAGGIAILVCFGVLASLGNNRESTFGEIAAEVEARKRAEGERAAQEGAAPGEEGAPGVEETPAAP